MPEHFQRPENALKRALEFLDVNKPKAAQEVLLDLIKSKRHRSWSKVHEEIMDQLVKLNVELKDSKAAKESLFQYRSTCHNVNIKSLEDVIRKYIQLAEQRVQTAKQEGLALAIERRKSAGLATEGMTDDSLLENIEDLEQPERSPEDLMLSSVTGEGTQERAETEVLIPWIKFLWEAYRNSLDLLRNNKMVERLYQEIAKMAMEFCTKYDRKNEFRRLSDSLRTHLNQITRNTKGQNAISLTNPESQAIQLDIRIYQLDFGIKIELWQEAFKAVEDIYYLMNIPKRAPHPGKLSEFYKKLGIVFSRAKMNLFHACTQHKLFKLTRDMRKNLSQAELSLLASRMLISTLAIPLTEVKHGLGKMLDIENALSEKHSKMARLLDLERSPSRASLMQDMIQRYGVLRIIPKPLAKLYTLLETDESNLKMRADIEEALDFLENNEITAFKDLYVAYGNKIRYVLASRILIQASKLYSTIKFPRLIKLLPDMSRQEVERMIVDASRIGQLRVRIDHSKDMINFGQESDPAPLYVDDEASIDSLANFRNADRTEWVSNHLNGLARVLETAIVQLQESDEARQLAARNRNYKSYLQARNKEFTKLKTRRTEIEDRIEDCEREERERQTREREKRKKAEEDVIEKQLEKERSAKRVADERRKQEEVRADEMRACQEKLDSMKKNELGAKLFEGLTAELLMTKWNGRFNELVDERVELMKRDKKEAQDKIRKQERSFDYNERAKRRTELDKIKAYVAEEQVAQRKLWNDMEDARLTNLRQEWESSRETKALLAFMKSDADQFRETLKTDRRAAYLTKKQKFDGEVEIERQKRLEERRLTRVENRREAWLEQCRLEEQRIKEQKEMEERQRLKEEEEKAQREKEEQRLREEKENQSYRPPRPRSPSPYDRRGPSPPGRRGLSPPRRDGGGAWRPGGNRRMSPDRGPDRWGPGPDRRGPPMRCMAPRTLTSWASWSITSWTSYGIA